MAENEKRIVIRVDPEKWQELDDRRHAERTSFQDLGVRLFGEWLEGRPVQKDPRNNADVAPEKSTFGDKLHVIGLKSVVTESNIPWVRALVGILEGGNEVAIRALKSNLLAFAEYVIAVPEVADGIADIAADERRLAALEERLVDARKAVTVGSPASAPKAGRKAAKKAV